MRLDIESLRAFRIVAEAGGVTRAATLLKLSQSAVSWKLKRLEERVGRPLTVLDARKLELTEDGKALLHHAIKITDAHDAAVAGFQLDSLTGEVRFGLTEDMAVQGIAAVIARFSQLYPQLGISVRLEQSRNLLRWLSSGEIDAALVQVTADRILASDVVLARDTLAWVAADKALAHLDPLPLVTFGPDCFYWPLMADALKRANRESRVVVQAPSTASVRTALATGLGVGVLRRRQVDGASDLQLLSDLTDPLPAVAQVLRFSRGLSRRIAAPLKSMILTSPLLANLV